MFVKIKKCLNCGIAHEWEFDGPTLRELRTIKKLTGLSGMAYATAADDGDPDSLAALIYVLHKRIKIEIPFDDVDLDLTDFEMEETEQEKAERDKLEKEMEKASKGKVTRITKNQSGPTDKVD